VTATAARTRWPVAYRVALIAVVVAQIITVSSGFFLTRLWEDEAYNLTVALNLISGQGYSSDGILAGGHPALYDVRISTGPVVLLPVAAVLAAGVDPVIGARAVMAVFYIGTLVAIFFTARRFAGRWGAVAALAATLGLDAARFVSPLQGPTDVLGEWPVVGFTVLALFLLRSRPAVAGLMLGLALQCKALAVLSVPAIVLVLIASTSGSMLGRLAAVVRFGLGVIVPTAVFEIVKLAVLGMPDYISSTRDLYYFLKSGGQSGIVVAPLEKVTTALGSYFAPPVLVAVVLLVAVAAIIAAAVSRGATAAKPFPAPQRVVGRHWLTAAAGGILVTWMGWWSLSTSDPLWIRHPAPGLLVSVPLLTAVAVRSAGELWERSGWRRSLGAIALGGVALVAVIQLVARPLEAVTPQFETLAQQREAARVLSGYPGETVQGQWGAFVSVGVLAGKRPVLSVDAAPAGTQMIEAFDQSANGRAIQRSEEERRCARDTQRLPRYILCVH
jgi:hypothetical protein